MPDILELESTARTAENADEVFDLSDVEVETLRRAALERSLPFDPQRRIYSRRELSVYGMVREGYTREEIRQLGFGPEAVSCFDERSKLAEELLRVDTPFGSGIKKWQLPIDMMPMRVQLTILPPNTTVAKHVHPASSPEAPGGGLRIVSKGRIFYEGREYGPGDWFFVPNGTPYTFTTDPKIPTILFYKYAFFGFEEGNRFSHPHAVPE
jgi:hypothetical protein